MHPLRNLSKRKRLSVASFGIASPNNQPNNLPNKKRIIFPIYGYYYKRGCNLQKNIKSKIKRELKRKNKNIKDISQRITMHCIAQNFQMKYIMSMVSTQNE